MMPEDGRLEACRGSGSFSNVPIMLTAKARIQTNIGFEYGADDYLTKPFNIMELKVRIRYPACAAGESRRRESASSGAI